MDVFNLHGDEWNRTEERDGWRSKDVWVGQRMNAELIGGSMYELEPGHKLFPYHTHHANEEWLLVVRGQPTLRTADGEQELREGDVAVFRRGKDGFHQVTNRTDSPIRILMISTLIAPDIVEYPDSGKVGARNAGASGSSSAGPGRCWTTGTARTEESCARRCERGASAWACLPRLASPPLPRRAAEQRPVGHQARLPGSGARIGSFASSDRCPGSHRHPFQIGRAVSGVRARLSRGGGRHAR